MFPGIRDNESFCPTFRHNNQMKLAIQNHVQKYLVLLELHKNVSNYK